MSSNPRMLARRCAVQALYQWQVGGADLSDIERQFLEELAITLALYRRFRQGETLSLHERETLEELLEKYCKLREPEAPPTEEGAPLEELVPHCCPPEIDDHYFRELLHGVPERTDVIDPALAEFADRPVAGIDPVERAILRLSGYELLFRPEIPYRVAVNEGINLAKQFGASQSHKYINGILDKVARKYRSTETGGKGRKS